MTDILTPSSPYYNIVMRESNEYNDIRFQSLNGGIGEFSKRYLYHLVYAMKFYKFDYLLRMDDDYFFCLNNFLQELTLPMIHNFHWGWVHCIEGIVRPEESMILFSRDIVEKFLSQDQNTIKCHPLADQMIGEWANDLELNGTFRHDDRLHHTPIVSKAPELRNNRNICDKYIGIHGCYPPDMKLFWANRGPRTKSMTTLKTHSRVCALKTFNWNNFLGKWKYQPKPCVSNPSWNTSMLQTKSGSYIGRQGS